MTTTALLPVQLIRFPFAVSVPAVPVARIATRDPYADVVKPSCSRVVTSQSLSTIVNARIARIGGLTVMANGHETENDRSTPGRESQLNCLPFRSSHASRAISPVRLQPHMRTQPSLAHFVFCTPFLVQL